LAGLPGVGKTTLATNLSKHTSAAYFRVDSVETALRNSAVAIKDPKDAGYLALAVVAKDNLKLDLDVIVDTVNPLKVTRELWADIAAASNAALLNVEVICSDQTIHRARIEGRHSDIKGHVLPSWQDVVEREYSQWDVDRLVIDTSKVSIDANTAIIAREFYNLKSTI